MPENKTQPTKVSVAKFIDTVDNVEKRKDAKTLLKLMRKITHEKPVMWGPSIVGFGTYHYKSTSREGDWLMTGFSPRKQALTIYIIPGFAEHKGLLKKLGPHKISGGSCLYIKRLADVDMTVLEKLIKNSFEQMKKRK